MTSINAFRTLASATGMLVCTIGAVAVVNTDFRSRGLSALDGHYQRVVEARFGAALPMREHAIHAWNAINLGLFGQVGPEIIIGKQDWLFTAEEFQRPSTDFAFEAELENAIIALAARGIQLVPVIVPDKARVYDDMLPHARMSEIETRYVFIQDVLASYGLPFIDVLASLDAARADGATFMRTDTHWSPFGAEIVAQQVAATLGDAVVTPSPFQTDTAFAQPFQGDLTAFVEVGPYAQLLGVEAETIDIATTQSVGGALGLFDDVTVPVALVGTSYSARADFNFAGFLQQQTGLDVVNHAVEGQGPFAPMRAFLSSEAFTTSSPLIVVWELPERYISLKETS